MNMLLKEWDGKMQKHEHSIHSLIHNEAFLATAVISFILISMVLLAIFTPNTGSHPNFPTPFGPFPYYNW